MAMLYELEVLFKATEKDDLIKMQLTPLLDVHWRNSRGMSLGSKEILDHFATFFVCLLAKTRLLTIKMKVIFNNYLYSL